MFVTKNQFLFLCTSAFIGVLGGVIYEPFGFVSKLFENKYITAIVDFAYFVVFAVFSAFLHYSFNYENLRLYCVFAELLGVLGYFKSFHNIIAIFGKICYNNIYITFKEMCNRVGRRKKD